MTKTITALSLALMGTAAIATAAIPTIAQLHNGHRILIVSGPADSAQLVAQRQSLARWQVQGRERDVATVFLDGTKVEGVSDTADTIRKRFAIPAKSFAVALVGKDGNVAFRSAKLVSGAEFERTIDAMPMRRAGQR